MLEKGKQALLQALKKLMEFMTFKTSTLRENIQKDYEITILTLSGVKYIEVFQIFCSMNCMSHQYICKVNSKINTLKDSLSWLYHDREIK